MTAPILRIEQLSKRFGGFVALDGVDLAVAPGERLGLIGPNGSGKSTLVNCICGTLRNEDGKVSFDGAQIDGLIAHERTRLGLARSFQLPQDIDQAQAKAKYDNGVLTLTLPKKSGGGAQRLAIE